SARRCRHRSCYRMAEISRDIALRIKLVIFDVDGVLTDNGVYIGEGVELKRFDIQDGLGIKLLAFAGLQVALVSGRRSSATTVRAADLGVECHQSDEGHKADAVRALMQKHGVEWNEIAWVGDDLPDLPAMQRVGLPVAVANSSEEVLACAAYVTSKDGGHGAVREFTETLLKARGQWRQLVAEYVAQRQ
ncbi:MAG: KdsC family phosphatase, partial [Gemmatimonadota bacterium]